MTGKVPYHLRVATEDDAGRLVGLCGQLGYPTSVEDLRRRLAGILADEDQAVFLAEGPDGAVAGWAHVALRPLLISELQAEIGGLVVDEAHRRQGIGRLLMEGAESWARSRGCAVVQLRSNVERQEAPFFYPGIGYTCVKTSYTFRKEL